MACCGRFNCFKYKGADKSTESIVFYRKYDDVCSSASECSTCSSDDDLDLSGSCREAKSDGEIIERRKNKLNDSPTLDWYFPDGDNAARNRCASLDTGSDLGGEADVSESEAGSGALFKRFSCLSSPDSESAWSTVLESDNIEPQTQISSGENVIGKQEVCQEEGTAGKEDDSSNVHKSQIANTKSPNAEFGAALKDDKDELQVSDGQSEPCNHGDKADTCEEHDRLENYKGAANRKDASTSGGRPGMVEAAKPTKNNFGLNRLNFQFYIEDQEWRRNHVRCHRYNILP